MGKRNPFVTTVGFKKGDPDHVNVAELLNSMSRGKVLFCKLNEAVSVTLNEAVSA